MVTAASN